MICIAAQPQLVRWAGGHGSQPAIVSIFRQIMNRWLVAHALKSAAGIPDGWWEKTRD